MRGRLIAVAVLSVACGRSGVAPPAPAAGQAGCYVLDPALAAPPFRFPDTLELAVEWFLPDDSTGGRLRVVRPPDASLTTYRTWGGRFWWVSRPDAVVVTKSDRAFGVEVVLHPGTDTVTGTARSFGPGPDRGAERQVGGRRVPCADLAR